MTKEFRNSALAGLFIGAVGVVGLAGIGLYAGAQQMGRAIAPILVPLPVSQQTQIVNRAGKSDRLDYVQPYNGRVLN